jgi:hypothetical protein
MNERLKELSTIAKNLTTDDAIHLRHIHNRTLSLDELGEIFAQKFAELIVRECGMMADEFELDVNRSGLVDRMKKHFGVE